MPEDMPFQSNGQTTEKLLESLQAGASITSFVEHNAEVFLSISLHEYLGALIKGKGVTKAWLIRESGINTRYFFNIMSGKKHPERDYVIRILLALKLSLRDTQWLLKATHYPQLYVRNKRDSVIIYALEHGLSVEECNAMLQKIMMGQI